MIKLYTGYDTTITEYRGDNFRLGPHSTLGGGIALGTTNRPNAFTVTVSLPPIQAETRKERMRLESVRLQKLIELIEAEKPAQTDYELMIKLVA